MYGTQEDRWFHDGFFDYYGFKRWALDTTDFAHSTLHIYLGVAIQLSLCVLLGKRISHPTPLYFVCFAELVNELHDILYKAAEIDRHYAAGYLTDWAHSIAVPTVLFVVARYSDLLGRPKG